MQKAQLNGDLGVAQVSRRLRPCNRIRHPTSAFPSDGEPSNRGSHQGIVQTRASCLQARQSRASILSLSGGVSKFLVRASCTLYRLYCYAYTAHERPLGPIDPAIVWPAMRHLPLSPEIAERTFRPFFVFTASHWQAAQRDTMSELAGVGHCPRLISSSLTYRDR